MSNQDFFSFFFSSPDFCPVDTLITLVSHIELNRWSSLMREHCPTVRNIHTWVTDVTSFLGGERKGMMWVQVVLGVTCVGFLTASQSLSLHSLGESVPSWRSMVPILFTPYKYLVIQNNAGWSTSPRVWESFIFFIFF